MVALEKVSSNKTFGGILTKYKFESSVLGNTTAKFNVFIPGEVTESKKAPILYYLSGLECSEDQGPQKGGFLKYAAEEGIALVFPDTSPRGAGVPGEDDAWDFGTAAGFYIDATAPEWAKHYRMYTHIREELPSVLKSNDFPLDFSRQSIFGHSMGGHGALTMYLKNVNTEQPYLSVSAFAPISNPTKAPWGEKAFKGYLQGGVEEGKVHDATELISKVKSKVNVLIDYGGGDKFYQQKQLLPENFVEAAQNAGHGPDQVTSRLQPGYDHSYYFISTFAADHIKFHAKFLNSK
ncbi:hypothetical protein M422DRAFT_74887 [Sphaerobolus stellatus SS14]|nr:hypothetical protein M422DRAFT_74887 [Sphaerobolus stellatus SS14]